jgi:hypothetical protein
MSAAAPPDGSPPPAPRKRRRSRMGVDHPYFPRPTPEERTAAIADPGPTWTQYFYRDFLRWWTVLFFFVIDVWIVSSFLHPLLPQVIVPSLVAALYLEFLAYQYLWGAAHIQRTGRSTPFVRTWYRPVAYGRLTEVGERVRAGGTLPTTGPDPEEFL